MQHTTQIITAGVYVNVAGYFPFLVGPTKSGQALAVFRLGGHREGQETGWECAAREAYEEASLRIIPREAPATYWVDSTDPEIAHPGTWPMQATDGVAPILVTSRDNGTITPMYLAHAYDEPQPQNEAKALLLLSPTDIAYITTSSVTLEQYLARGGKAIFRADLPQHLPLKPFLQLHWLHKLLQMHPEIADE
ncbi:hypothetical protein [Ktedonobacter racemifer]|uniref:NUDIX hydrolase n=1 Tax=Ktedonobacter racemifer DSM 44963 TaxID=485913 RepID=D6U4Y2_KTERA|nr:hypothetical protein [Ktedonobacter racemifer]EFH81562.1 NUDIX hydrolase [Ktedonobacter racemifer DSM 44963]